MANRLIADMTSEEVEARRRYYRLWRIAHPGYMTKKSREWNAAHPGCMAKKKREWRAANPERCTAMNARRCSKQRIRKARMEEAAALLYMGSH